MSRIGLVDLDSKMPNLALMRLASYHRREGAEIVFPYTNTGADKVFVGTVFTRSHRAAKRWASIGAEVGGTGWDLHKDLPPEVEACPPDYSLYPAASYGLGFSSRGCIRRCPFCVVPEKEGPIRSVATIGELVRSGSDFLVLLDNNFLANPDRDARLDEIIERGLTVNFNQGLDIRFVNQDVARRLSRIRTANVRRTSSTLYFAFDDLGLERTVRRGVAELKKAGIQPYRLMFYILVGFDTTFEEDMYRFNVLRELGAPPYVMLYNGQGTKELRHFARWVNARIYKVCAWGEYRPHLRSTAFRRLL